MSSTIFYLSHYLHIHFHISMHEMCSCSNRQRLGQSLASRLGWLGETWIRMMCELMKGWWTLGLKTQIKIRWLNHFRCMNWCHKAWLDSWLLTTRAKCEAAGERWNMMKLLRHIPLPFCSVSTPWNTVWQAAWATTARPEVCMSSEIRFRFCNVRSQEMSAESHTEIRPTL